MAMEWEDRLWLVGCWLEVRAAQTTDIMLSESGARVECQDGQGRSQRRQLAAPVLERMYLLRRRSTGVFPGSLARPWGSRLRELGQLIQREEIEPVRIWSDGQRLRLYGLQQGTALRQEYDLATWSAPEAPTPLAK
jgi:hypothetical protein